MADITISLNEQSLQIPCGSTLRQLVALHKPKADLMVVNGYPETADIPLKEGDSVTLIRRGEQPDLDELELHAA